MRICGIPVEDRDELDASSRHVAARVAARDRRTTPYAAAVRSSSRELS
jgi:hypothetical protein